MELTINLTEAQAEAIANEYGSTDYCATYVAMLADHLIEKKVADDRAKKVAELMALPNGDLDTLVSAAEAMKAEAVEAPPVKE